jgi:hypothetical protein
MSNGSLFIIITALSLSIGAGECFVPAKVLSILIDTLQSDMDIGQVSESLTHDQIVRNGIVQSVVRYFYDQPNGTVNINLTQIDNEYYNINKLYTDYYGGARVCWKSFENVIETFQNDVASVDFDATTKDMPFAHFDAEKFIESNRRVVEFKKMINYSLSMKDYEQAREDCGKM